MRFRLLLAAGTVPLLMSAAAPAHADRTEAFSLEELGVSCGQSMSLVDMEAVSGRDRRSEYLGLFVLGGLAVTGAAGAYVERRQRLRSAP